MRTPLVPSVIKTIKLPQELVDQIEDYRTKHDYRSWTFALVRLASIGLMQQGYDVIDLRPWGGDRKSGPSK